MRTAIEGGSAPHRRLLDEIFVGLGATEIERVRVEERAALFEPDHRPTPEQINDGTGLLLRLVASASASARAKWEIRLVAGALRELARRDRLTQIVWVDFGSGGHSLNGRGSTHDLLSAGEIEQMRVEIAEGAAASGALLESLEILRPLGHAWAVRLHVDEPHTYLRQRFPAFLAAVEPCSKRCGGARYIEVRDRQPTAVLVEAHAANGGSSSLRVDVKCCDPFVRIGRSISERPARCPVFD